MSQSLFRAEALAFHRHRLYGEVLVLPSLSTRLLSLAIVVVVILAIVFLALGEFARKETVRGYLRPTNGLVKVQAASSGRLLAAHVAPGDWVEKGQSLATLGSARTLADGREFSAVANAELTEQIRQVEKDLQGEEQRRALELQRLQGQLAHLQAASDAAVAERERRFRQLQLTGNRLQQVEELVQAGHLARSQLDVVVVEHLQQESAVAEIDDRRAAQHAEIKQLELELRRLPMDVAARRSAIEQRLREYRLRQAELLGQTQVVLTAPRSGRIGDWYAEVGALIEPDRTLVTLFDENDPLEAVLFVPSRSVGFISVGQTLRLRFDAFPFQRFGVFEATLKRIDDALLLPQEVREPVALNEPVYRVRATLAKDRLLAYGAEHRFRAGLLFEADVVLDQRNLLQWLFDPLLSLRGRW